MQRPLPGLELELNARLLSAPRLHCGFERCQRSGCEVSGSRFRIGSKGSPSHSCIVSCLTETEWAIAGKPSKDTGSGSQEQTYVKTVIELHDKYLEVSCG